MCVNISIEINFLLIFGFTWVVFLIYIYLFIFFIFFFSFCNNTFPQNLPFSFCLAVDLIRHSFPAGKASCTSA